MDAPRFDRFAKILAAPRSRRGALAAALGSAIGLVSVGSLPSPEGVASRKKSRRKNRQHGDVIAQGPCGDGGPKHNACKRHGQCCTGYCDRKKRCRCRRPGDPCTEDRNCCPDRVGATCQDGTCQPASSTCALSGQSCSSAMRCCEEQQGVTCQNGICRFPVAGECNPGETRACYGGSAGTENVGICQPGVQTCTASGTWGACAGEVLPQAETCNGLDDDCDGVIDDGALCPLRPNATSACVSGACQITCISGFGDCDGNPATGCEASFTDINNCGGCGNVCGTCPGGAPRVCNAFICGCGGPVGGSLEG